LAVAVDASSSLIDADNALATWTDVTSAAQALTVMRPTIDVCAARATPAPAVRTPSGSTSRPPGLATIVAV
jgi:hypothetical protein